jgi:predicted DNA-binding protein (MmcQ/YjbR family)
MDDDPYLERIRRICLGLPEVEEIEMWGGPLFRVRRRRFALFNGVGFPNRSLHVVTDPAERAALLQDDRFEMSTHHPRQGWMAMNLDAARVDWSEVTELLETAYRLVTPKSRR